jgi:type IV secretory pathway VirB4 component
LKKKELTRIKFNRALSNVLTPIGGLEYKKTHFRIGDILGEVFVIVKYPQEVKMGWIEDICNIPNTITSFNVLPTEKDVLMQKISKGKFDNENSLDGVTDEILRQRLEREIDDARELINRLDNRGETLVYFVIGVMVIAETEEELRERAKNVKTKLITMQMKGRRLTNLSRNSFRHMSPFFVPDKTINKIASRNMLESSWIGGFPFSSSGFNDEVNYYFAKDTNGGAIILDLWKRGGDRTNSNVVIMGTAGVGKSTVAKHLILKEYMMGTRQIIIDPEREYKDMTYNLEGKWIDVGSGRGGMINPLQIKQVPLDDDTNTYLENSDDSKGMGAMALHFQTLHTFFKLLYPELTSSEEAVLDEMLEKLYNKFNISWNTDITNIPNDKFPILEDLYNLIIENIDNEKEDIKKQKLVLIKNLIRGICIGAESSLFNGKTTVETDSAVVCFDTFNLQNASERVKKAQYFNILTYCWELMSKDKEEKTMLVCDEAYLLIDPQVPQTLVFLRNVSKRCRKYEGSLVIISHSVVDFIDDSVRMYGQAILDMATYKILMGTDGKNLEDTKEIFKLTEAQADFLYKKKRNMGVFIIGSNRVFANFLVKDKELKIFGKGGGR